MGLICMFIVPADFHTEYRNTLHSVASMALTFSMLKKPTPVTHPCRPVTYQPNTEVRPIGKLVHDVNKVLIPLIIRLLVSTIEDIPPKYLFLMILLPFLISAKKKMFFRLIELLSFRCCITTYYLLTSNYNESVTLNDRTTCGMI